MHPLLPLELLPVAFAEPILVDGVPKSQRDE